MAWDKEFREAQGTVEAALADVESRHTWSFEQVRAALHAQFDATAIALTPTADFDEIARKNGYVKVEAGQVVADQELLARMLKFVKEEIDQEVDNPMYHGRACEEFITLRDDIEKTMNTATVNSDQVVVDRSVLAACHDDMMKFLDADKAVILDEANHE